MKITKMRIVAFLLVTALSMSVFPSPVFAEESEPVTTETTENEEVKEVEQEQEVVETDDPITDQEDTTQESDEIEEESDSEENEADLLSDDTVNKSISKNDTIEGTDYHVTSLKKYSVAPDVSEKVIVTNNEEGNLQTVANVMEINTSGGKAKVVGGYGKRNPATEGWTFSTTTAQSHLYEQTHNANVVGGVNASLFNITTGEPMGVLVMEGTTYKEDMGLPYLAAFDDGSVGIFYGGTTLASATSQQTQKQGHQVNLVDAISGWVVLVDGDQVASNGSNGGYYPRTAVGLKEDGTVVMMQSDGTQAPRSTGYTLEEMGYMMKSLGCVIALELDEGGSSTFISQREGESDLSLRNTPAGGSERGVASTILVVSNATADGSFDHASITPNAEYYTPNTSVTLTATGIDGSGALAGGVPETVTWALAPGYEQMGTLENSSVNGNNATVDFISNGTLGDVEIQMLNGTSVVGTTTIHIQEPDSLSFASKEVNLKYGEESDLGLKAKYQGAMVNLKGGDIEWTLSEESAGTFDGIKFITTSDKKVSVSAQVTATYGELSATTILNIGKQPTVILDGGDTDQWNYSNIGTTVNSFDGLGAQDVATYSYAGRGGVVKGSVVSDSDPEYADIVRFGSKAIKLDFDWTGITGTDGACLGLGSPLDVPGTPTAIGAWVYIPENVPVPWIRAQIQTSTNNGEKWIDAYVNFTSEHGEGTVTGWQYIEADLTQYAGSLIRVNSGMLLRAMVTTSGIGWTTTDGVKLDKSALKGYILLDNIQIVYGANNQDVTNPNINNIQLINPDGTKSELENGMELASNTLNFFVSYDDNQATDENATGIESAYFYFDGNYYGEGSIDNLGSTLTGLELSNGEHSLTFYLKDGYGNVTRETRYFTVNGNEEYTKVSLDTSKNPLVGKDYVLTLESNKVSNVSSVETTIVIPSDYPIKNVEFASGFTGTYSYNQAKSELKISAQGDGTQTGSEIAKIVLEIPKSTTKGASINLQVNQGSYEVVDSSCATNVDLWARGFSTNKKSIPIQATYLLETETLIVGQPATITVTENGKPKADVEIFMTGDISLGKTDENGKLISNALTVAAGSYTLYALDADGNYSYLVPVTCFNANGDEEGKPFNVSINIAKDLSTEKNISWMSNPVATEEVAKIKLSSSEDMNGATTIDGETSLVTYSGSGLVNRVNSVYLTNLTPGTKYYYQIGDGKVWSDVKSFTTKPAKDESAEFFVIADIQEEDALTGFGRIANYLDEGNYDFGIQTGDAVDNVRFYNQWEDAINLFELVPDYDMIHVIGNHEDDDDNNGGYAAKQTFNLEGDWYSIEYGDVYVAVLNHVTSSESLQAFSNWLQEDAAKSTCTWKVVTSHVPVYTTNPAAANQAYMDIVSDAMEAANIDFYFAGDAHSYARTAPLTDMQVDEDNGVVYYICGSTGGKSYAAVDVPEYNFQVATIDFESVYVDVKADFDSIEVTAYNIDANGNRTVLDSYSKEIPYCENDEHNYVYDKNTDNLTCLDCPTVTTAAKDMYSGFATDKETGKKMYFIAGKYVTGYVQLERTAYFFDNNGLGYEGSFNLGGETCYYEGGTFVRSDNANVIAAGWCGDNADYAIYSDGTIVIGGSGGLNTSSRENVPWQNYRGFIKKVVFESGIDYISDYAFYDCDALTTVEFEEGSKMKTIGGAAFFSCGPLKNVVLPEGVETIYGNAFASCPNLESVYIPDSVSYISSVAFKNSPKLVLSVAPDSYAKECAIKYNVAYEERVPVDIASGKCGDNLTWTLSSDGLLVILGDGAMTNYGAAKDVPWNSYSKSIRSVQISAGVTNLSDYAFFGCENLSSVTFKRGSKLQTIGGSVFYGCKKLTEIDLPQGLSVIYGNTFAHCTKLESVYLPDTISYMSSSVYNHSSNVVLSVASDSYAKDYAEKHNIKYEERKIVEVESGKCGNNLSWKLMSDGVLTITGNGAMTTFKSAESVPWASYRTMIKEVHIGSGVTSLSDYAFYGCERLTVVEFGKDSQLQVIGGSVFYGCKTLPEIELPEKVSTIYGNTFAHCSKLSSVYLPESISYMSSSVYNKSYKVVLSVGYDSYAKSYAEKNNIKYTERKVVELGSGKCGTSVSWKLTSDGILNITGNGAMASYKTAESLPWNSYRNVIKVVNIGAGVTTISDYAFYRCSNLEEVNFATQSVLNTIGGSSFYRCSSLTSVTLPNFVKTIHGNAFAKCENLKSVSVPKYINYISNSAFTGSNKVVITFRAY
ncbi:leucine-rich repeat protein [Floccifex sp.]|uniref:leucine-rich repeat protein n=1 Tax=Floccifex sp. TaxID=2815810 RepID=UPI003F04D823